MNGHHLDQHILDRLNEPEPQGTALMRLLLEIYLRINLPFTLFSPRACLWSIECLGRLANRLGMIGPRADEVAAIFGRILEKESKGIASGIAGLSFKNELFSFILRHRGIEAAGPFLDKKDLAPLVRMRDNKQAAVLVCGHTGPLNGIMACIHFAEVPIFVLRAGKPPYETRNETEIGVIKGGAGSHALVLKRAIDELKSGGLVLMAFDSTYGGAVVKNVPFMGRCMTFRRGLGALARLSGAPVVPVSVRWMLNSSRFQFRVHTALPIPDAGYEAREEYDKQVISEATRWLESEIRKTPEQLQWHFLRRILSYPPASAMSL